ncbi:MAG TPA: glycerophosphodiester phosphodiesterase family protein [Candidatus Saccharimonadales bacterium]|jgi:glycerophosphoryl diester phosphodiesterase
MLKTTKDTGKTAKNVTKISAPVIDEADMTIIGHRGASGYEPENTLASFKKALDLGVDMIELDVYVIETGELVVIHDDKVDRTTNGTGYVESFTLSQLRTLDAGRGQKVPMLREVLDLINKRVPVNIELKGEGTAQPVAATIREYIEKGWKPSQFRVLSFDHIELKRFIARMPGIRAGASYEGVLDGFAEDASKLGASMTVVESDFVLPESVKEAHDKGLEVLVYTVNTRAEARRLRKLNVDGIFSDYPDKVAPRFAPAMVRR